MLKKNLNRFKAISTRLGKNTDCQFRIYISIILSSVPEQLNVGSQNSEPDPRGKYQQRLIKFSQIWSVECGHGFNCAKC